MVKVLTVVLSRVMGNCCSPGSENDLSDFTNSAPTLTNTETPSGQTVVPQTHPSPQEPSFSNHNIHTLDHISDREGEIIGY